MVIQATAENMLLKIALLMCLAYMAAAEECTPMRMLKVKDQWSRAYSYGVSRENFDEAVFEEFFRRYPDAVEKYFQRVRGNNIYSPDFRAHMARVMAGLDMTINMLRETEAREVQLAHLKEQHIGLNVDAEYFEGFSHAVKYAVQKRVGHCFDKDAWVACMGMIKAGIKH